MRPIDPIFIPRVAPRTASRPATPPVARPVTAPVVKPAAVTAPPKVLPTTTSVPKELPKATSVPKELPKATSLPKELPKATSLPKAVTPQATPVPRQNFTPQRASSTPRILSTPRGGGGRGHGPLRQRVDRHANKQAAASSSEASERLAVEFDSQSRPVRHRQTALGIDPEDVVLEWIPPSGEVDLV